MNAPLIIYDKLEKASQTFRVLMHPDRISIIDLLVQEERVEVGKIMSTLNLGQAVCSNHLSVLKRNNLVTSRRQGKNVLYSVKLSKLQNIIECINKCS
jgi:DNA-binding transcriptional ArsR family regulator